MRKTNRIRRFAFTAALAAFLASGAYAFTASNTVPGTQVGAGSGTISGYTATNVQYTLDATTPTNLNAVAFTIAPATTSAVRVQLCERRRLVLLHEHRRRRLVRHDLARSGDGRGRHPADGGRSAVAPDRAGPTTPGPARPLSLPN